MPKTPHGHPGTQKNGFAAMKLRAHCFRFMHGQEHRAGHWKTPHAPENTAAVFFYSTILLMYNWTYVSSHCCASQTLRISSVSSLGRPWRVSSVHLSSFESFPFPGPRCAVRMCLPSTHCLQVLGLQTGLGTQIKFSECAMRVRLRYSPGPLYWQ